MSDRRQPVLFAGEWIRAGDFVVINPRDGRVYRATQADGRYDFVAADDYSLGDPIPFRLTFAMDGTPQRNPDEDLAAMRDLVHRIAMVIDPGGDLATMVELGWAKIDPGLIRAYRRKFDAQEAKSADSAGRNAEPGQEKP